MIFGVAHHTGINFVSQRKNFNFKEKGEKKE